MLSILLGHVQSRGRNGTAPHLPYIGDVPFYASDATNNVGKVKGLGKILFVRGLLLPGVTVDGGEKSGKFNPGLRDAGGLGKHKDFDRYTKHSFTCSGQLSASYPFNRPSAPVPELVLGLLVTGQFVQSSWSCHCALPLFLGRSNRALYRLDE